MMKKYIWISLLLLLSCGSRKSSVEKSKQTTETKTEQESTTKVESETTSESTFDFSKFLDNQDISIFSDGNPYTINYNGFSFTGTAAVNISNKKEQTKVNFIEKIKTIYKAVTQYRTQTSYKTQYIYKSKETERKVYPWYWIVIGTILIWELLKMGIKKAFPGLNLKGIIERLNLKR